MSNVSIVDQLREMRLSAMAREFEAQAQDPAISSCFRLRNQRSTMMLSAQRFRPSMLCVMWYSFKRLLYSLPVN